MAGNKISCDTRQHSRAGVDGCSTSLVFKPFVWLLRLSAVMYRPDVLSDNWACPCTQREGNVHKPLRKARHRFMRWTQAAILGIPVVISWGHAIKILSCFATVHVSIMNPDFQTLMIFIFVTVSMTFMTTVVMVKFSKGLAALAHRLCHIQRKYNIRKDWNFRKWGIVGGVFVALSLIFVLFLSFEMVTNTDFQNIFKSLLVVTVCPFGTEQSPVSLFFLCMWSLIMFLLSGFATYTTIAIFSSYCSVVIYLLNKCLDDRHGKKREEARDTWICTSNILQYHQDLCDFVSQGNDNFKHFMLSLYCLTIPAICFNTNTLIRGQQVSRGIFIIALTNELTMLILLLATVLKAATINTKAEEVRENLLRFEPHEDWSDKDLNMATLLSARLSRVEIGITVMDLFVIDKAHILTLMGILVSYTILIIQFDPSKIPNLPHGNITGV